MKRSFIVALAWVLACAPMMWSVHVPEAHAAPVSVSCASTAVTESALTGNDVTFTDGGGDGTCTIDEAISAASIVVETGVTLTHPQGDVQGITITTTGNFQIDSGATISADALGCLAKTGPNASNACSTGDPSFGGEGGTASGGWASGAGHGGIGGPGFNNDGGGTYYGSTIYPSLFGAGGGNNSGGTGGGFVHLSVGGDMALGGTITADGGTPVGGNNGGGSGGSVWIGVGGALSGSGSISADGGSASNASNGAGGGGRVSVTYASGTVTTIQTNTTVTAGATGKTSGSGTVLWITDPDGDTDVSDGYNTAETSDDTWLLNGARFDFLDDDDGADDSSVDLSLSVLTVTTTATNSTVGSDVTSVNIDVATLSVSGNGAISCLDTSTASWNWSGITSFSWADQNLTCPEIDWGTNVDLTFSGSAAITASKAEDIDALTINNNDSENKRGLTLTGTASWTGNVLLENATTVSIGSGTSLSANAKGCTSARGPNGSNVCASATSGAGTTNSGQGGTGAGYGGAGGVNNAAQAGGTTYGTAAAPTYLGSGGGNGNGSNQGGYGGGFIRIITSGDATIDGTLSSNGANGTSFGGGGSGGSVYIVVGGTLYGTGSATANGGAAGNAIAGIGGGGRIALAYAEIDGDQTVTGSLTAAAGTTTGHAASAGTTSSYQIVAFSSATTSVSSGSTVDTLTIVFNQNVDITDASGADGLDVITLSASSGTCTIATDDYSAAATNTLVLSVTCSATNNTGITISPTYTTAGSSSIVDSATSTEALSGTTVTGTDGAAPVILTSYTGNTQVGRVTRLDLTFSEQVDVTDAGGSGDGFDAVTLENETSGTCTISNSDYANPNTTTQTFSVSCSDNDNTAVLFDPQYATAGSSTIIDENGNEMANGTTVTTVDAAEPYPISIEYLDTDTDGTVNAVDIQFSEAIASGTFSYSASDWTFTTASELNLADTGASLRTTDVANDTVRLTVSADADETGHSTTPLVLYTNNGNVLQDGTGNATETFNESWNVNDGAGPVLLSSDPVDGDTLISTSTTIALTFSEPINTDSFAYDCCGTATDPGRSGAWTEGDTVYTISAVGTWYSNSDITIEITDAPDDFDNALAGAVDGYDNPFTFTTMPGGQGVWVLFGNGTGISEGNTARVVSPNSPSTYIGGRELPVSWVVSGDSVTSASLQYSTDQGLSWQNVTSNLPKTGTYQWVLPNMDATKVKVRVRANDAHGDEIVRDDSDEYFAITASAPAPQVSDGTETQTGSENAPVATMTRPDGSSVELFEGYVFRGDQLSGVYLVRNGKRYVFPSESVFFSYYDSFDQVLFVQDDQLRKLPLGGRVTMASGRMIKIQSDDRVFQVQENGTIRHIPDEATARSLYGDTWNKQITDINVTFWLDYPQGVPLESVEG